MIPAIYYVNFVAVSHVSFLSLTVLVVLELGLKNLKTRSNTPSPMMVRERDNVVLLVPFGTH